MSPRPKNPPPDRRREILDAAVRLFAEKGYAAVTNAEIAKEAGVTAPALYYYFSSKEELFQAAVREHVGAFIPAVAEATKEECRAAHWNEERFRALYRSTVSFLTGEKTRILLRIVLAEGPRRPEIRQVWMDQVAAIMELLGPYLESAAQDGHIRAMDPRLVFLLLHGPVLSTIIARDFLQVPALQGVSDEAVAHAVMETTFAGLLADRREENRGRSRGADPHA